jgi:xanthine dehydrogenase YagR molybdenum-binding subunit
VLLPNGKLVVSSATADIGTGTYTSMCLIAAEALGLPLEDITFKLGDSDLPLAPLEGGSWTVSSVGSAVWKACQRIQSELLRLAGVPEKSPFHQAHLEDVEFVRGTIRLKKRPWEALRILDVLKSTNGKPITKTVTSIPNLLKQKMHTGASHSAVFLEVAVDEDFGTVEIRRIVNAAAAGRILNPKTARSQIVGGVVMGIGMALQEESWLDNKLGRFMNHNLAEYHVPVNKDIPEIDVIFIPEEDRVVNPLGMKGLGELGIVGTAAAVSNAIFHATGVRLRDVPFTPDKFLTAASR